MLDMELRDPDAPEELHVHHKPWSAALYEDVEFAQDQSHFWRSPCIVASSTQQGIVNV